MTACVLTILVTAPLGELILLVLGGILLESDEASFNGIVHEIQIHTPTYSFEPPTKTAESKPPTNGFSPSPNGFTRQMFMSRNEDNMQFRM